MDLGCGNGRVHELFDADKNIEYYGLDLSKELIKHAKAKVPSGHFVVGDLLNTPYEDAEFDFVISAATLHHIPSNKSRLEAIKEIYRITKPGGYILITNWYFWNKPFYVRRVLQSFWGQIRGLSKLEPGDFFMAWRDGSGKIITKRYFHAWRKAELRNTLKKVGFEIVRVSLYFKRDKKVGNNLIAIARKPK